MKVKERNHKLNLDLFSSHYWPRYIYWNTWKGKHELKFVRLKCQDIQFRDYSFQLHLN